MIVDQVHRMLLLAAVVVGAALVVGAPTAATATSCASHPDASPRAIAEGAEELAVEGTFREHYDGAILGTRWCLWRRKTTVNNPTTEVPKP